MDTLFRYELKEYFQHRDNLIQVDGVPLYKNRVVVPHDLRGAVLETLYSAHQGITGMSLRAQAGVWWPGITPQIKDVRDKIIHFSALPQITSSQVVIITLLLQTDSVGGPLCSFVGDLLIIRTNY